MRSRVSFNGHVLTDLFDVSDVMRPLGGRKVLSEDADSVEGIRVRGSKRTSFTVSMRLWLRGRTKREREQQRIMLAAILDADEEAKLWFEDQGDLYYLAMPSGDFPVTEYMNCSAVDVSFTVAKPWMYGACRKASLPSGSTTGLTLSGTEEVMPTIEASSAVRGSASHVWGVRFGASDKLRVELPDGLAHKVVLDCANRVCTVDGEVTIPVIYDDWFELAPGTYSVGCCDGSGAITVSWQERWS